MRFGVMLPHFGPFASHELLIDGTRRLEELGFDSVWVALAGSNQVVRIDPTTNDVTAPIVASAEVVYERPDGR